MSTADQILDVAESLIQARGYHGVSFQDIADQIGIKKPSLYYHFASKAELGRAVIARYRTTMRKIADQHDPAAENDHWHVLSLYLEPIIQLGRAPQSACLCGVLGGEYLGLPDEMRADITAFFDEHQTWLAQLLRSGRSAGHFQFHGEPELMARLIFSAIEGGMIIKRTTADLGYFDQVIAAISALLGKPDS